MRIPPIAAIVLIAISTVSPAFVRAEVPGGVATPQQGPVDTMPGYHDTLQSGQPVYAPVGVPAGTVRGYGSTSGWPEGGATAQYRPDLMTGTAPLISPYLLDHDRRPDGRYTVGRREDALLSPLVPQSAVIYGEDGRSSTTFSSAAGLLLRRDLDLEASQFKAGPLYIHFTQLDLVGLYSDISGPYSNVIPEDGFIAAVGLTFNIDLRISPRTFLEASGTVYYLPIQNSFGFYSGTGTSTFLRAEHSFEVDRWDITIYDYFDLITPLSYLNQFGTSGSAVDRSGLYSLGFFSGGFQQAFDSDRLYFRNSLGVRGSTFLSSDLRFTTSYEHLDLWSGNNLHYERGIEHINAGIYYEPKDLWFLPWLTYDAYIFDNYRSAFHQVFLGASLPISRAVQAYARVGWQWNEGDIGQGFADGNLAWDIGVNHQIDRQWTQSAAVGSSYRISPLLEHSQGEYVAYNLNFKSAYSSFYGGGSFAWTNDDTHFRNDHTSIYTLYTGGNLTDNTSIRGTMIYAPTDFTEGHRNVWLYRAELDHMFTPTLSMKFIYQLTDYHTTAADGTYLDNLLMLVLSKRL